MSFLSPLRAVVEFVFPVLEYLPGLRETMGFILVFFLPGFCWTLVFFSGKRVSVVERVALSFGISIALVTLTIFAMNKLAGVEITGVSSLAAILVLIVVPLIWYGIKRFVLPGRR